MRQKGSKNKSHPFNLGINTTSNTMTISQEPYAEDMAPLAEHDSPQSKKPEGGNEMHEVDSQRAKCRLAEEEEKMTQIVARRRRRRRRFITSYQLH